MAFCSNCGAKLEDGARFCPECGTPVGAAQKGQAAPNPGVAQQQRSTAQPAGQPADTQGYKKLGGWLLVFVICQGIGALYALYNLVKYMQMAAYFGSGYIQPEFGTILALILSAGLGIATVVLVVQRHPKFLRLYQIFRIVEIGVSVLAGIPVIISLSRVSFQLMASSAISVVPGAVGLILMTMYFCKSVRVRTYMGSTEYLDTALFKIGA